MENLEQLKIYETGSMEHAHLDIEIIEMVYKHFEYLSKYQELKHNKSDIYKLFREPDFRGYFIYNEHGLLVSYLLGEEMISNDGRRIFYIAYVYTSPFYRKKGLASILIKKCIDRSVNIRGIKFIVLTVNSLHNNTVKLYEKLGFNFDPIIDTVNPFVVMSYQSD